MPRKAISPFLCILVGIPELQLPAMVVKNGKTICADISSLRSNVNNISENWTLLPDIERRLPDIGEQVILTGQYMLLLVVLPPMLSMQRGCWSNIAIRAG